MQSMSVDMRSKKGLDPTKEETNRSQLEKSQDKQAIDKVGSMKFKISFMRGKFFKNDELSQVLLTEEEKKRMKKKAAPSNLVKCQTEIMDNHHSYQIHHYSAPKHLEEHQDDYFQTKIEHIPVSRMNSSDKKFESDSPVRQVSDSSPMQRSTSES